MRKKDVVEKILERAYGEAYLVGSPTPGRVAKAIRSGQDLPEPCRPGKVIERLSEEEREVLQTVTAEDFDHQMIFAKAAGIVK